MRPGRVPERLTADAKPPAGAVPRSHPGLTHRLTRNELYPNYIGDSWLGRYERA